jgi:hypothetical protein
MSKGATSMFEFCACGEQELQPSWLRVVCERTSHTRECCFSELTPAFSHRLKS